MFKYPWKRDTLIVNLKEMADLDYQKRVWGTDHDGIHEGVSSRFDFFIEEENLDERAIEWVSYYLYEDEVKVIERFAKIFCTVILSMKNQYDDNEAINHRDWPEVILAANVALRKILENNNRV